MAYHVAGARIPVAAYGWTGKDLGVGMGGGIRPPWSKVTSSSDLRRGMSVVRSRVPMVARQTMGARCCGSPTWATMRPWGYGIRPPWRRSPTPPIPRQCVVGRWMAIEAGALLLPLVLLVDGRRSGRPGIGRDLASSRSGEEEEKQRWQGTGGGIGWSGAGGRKLAGWDVGVVVR